jgi:hypothetical protein
MSAPAEPGFATRNSTQAPTMCAQGGWRVPVRLALSSGGMTTFTVPPRHASAAVGHRREEDVCLRVAGREAIGRRNPAPWR